MKAKILKKEAMFIAGVTGSGDETAKAWEALMKIQKMNPLTNQDNEPGVEGYEVRLYPPAGNAKVHVGMRVKDTRVPAEYKVVSLPATTYAGFEVYPAKGYESGNTEMNLWLEENRTIYKQALLDRMKYIIEVYDRRYKGEKDPVSVVGILVPVIKLKG